MIGQLHNIFWLGTKELRSVLRDSVMLIFIIWSFSLGITMKSAAGGDTVNNASVGIVDQDLSGLSGRIANALFPPYFQDPRMIDASEINAAMNRGDFMFVVVIPPNFEADIIKGNPATVQINADATAVSQAGLGTGYIQNIVNDEVQRFASGSDASAEPATINLIQRRHFNAAGIATWFNSIVSLLDQLTMLTIILTGAALLREREHGTIEHLMVMPLNSFQIAMAKIWANGLIILVCFVASFVLLIEGYLSVPLSGSFLLLMAGTVIYLFAAAAIGLFLGTISKSMAQFALLLIITIFPMQMLSGGMAPAESQPDFIRPFTWFLPSRHYMSFGQAIAFRGAGLDVVWRDFLTIAGLGAAFLAASLLLFRRSLSTEK